MESMYAGVVKRQKMIIIKTKRRRFGHENKMRARDIVPINFWKLTK